MEPIKAVKGIAVPIRRPDVDTDAVIPKQFLKSIARTGFGKYLFFDWRFFDGDLNKPNPGFVLNQPRYKNPKILIGAGSFGIGSSREHAPWALTDFGFRCVIAPAFGDIFYNNSQKNGLLLARVQPGDADRLMSEVEKTEGCQLTVDLPAQTITSPGGLKIAFTIDAEAKKRLLEGLDDIGITLKHEPEITRFEKQRQPSRPWL